MGQQIQRIYEVQVGKTIVSTLDLRFQVTKTLKREPNTAEVTIFNLNEDSRGAFSETPNQTMQIRVGYRGRPEQSPALQAVDDIIGAGDSGQLGIIYTGDVRSVHNSYSPPDWETLVESGDGEIAIQRSRINKSFAAGTPVKVVIKELAKSMRVGLGNAAERILETGSLKEAGTEFLNGVTVSGQSHRELEALVKSTGRELSIQDGTIQILDLGQPLRDTSVVLTSDTGLIGTPTIGDKGIVKFRALLNPAIVPGRQIELKARALNGRFRAERCDYTGDTTGQDWYVDVEAKEL